MKKNALSTKRQRIGSYEVVERLKQTRFGQAYLGWQEEEGKQVIIEVFQPPLAEELEGNFLSLARELMKLQHPHILPIRDQGIHNHEPFLVTDYRPYWTLRDIYPRGSRQPLVMSLPHLKQLASALHYAHTRGVVHGDLRPENILLDGENTSLLTGFVIETILQNRVRYKDQSAEVTHKAGPFSVPGGSGQASSASDQYWLAVLVYELLCGTLPFESLHQEGDISSFLRQKAPGISSGVERTLMKALEKDPEQRFTDVEAFVSALEEAHMRPTEAVDRKTPVAIPTLPPGKDGKEVIARIPTQPVPSGNASDESAPLPEHEHPLSLPLPVKEANVPQTPDQLASEDTVPLQSPPRRLQKPQHEGDAAMTRRSFAVGLVGLAALGGAGGWYLLNQRLSTSLPPVHGSRPATQAIIDKTNVLIFTGHLASVNAVTWSPDGKLIASASDDASVQIFHASSGQRTVIYSGHTEEVATVGWSPNGQFIASGGQDGTVQVWQAGTGTETLTYRGHASRVNGASWSRDSRSIASGSEDRNVQVWNASNGSLDINFLGHRAGVLCVGWQPDNSSVASGSWDGTLRDWAITQHSTHFASGNQIFSYRGHGKSEVNALAWSPDSTLIASAGADQTVQISHGSDGTPVLPFFTRHKSRSNINSVLSVAWSPDGGSIASGDTDGNVYVWKATDQKVFFTYSGHKGAVNALVWSPDGKTIASAGADNTVQVWQPG